MKHFHLFYLVLLCLVGLASSCDSDDGIQENTQESADFIALRNTMRSIENTSWVLINYDQDPFEENYENTIALEFDAAEEGDIGFGGRIIVNAYAGTFTIDQEEGLIYENDDTITTLVASEIERDNEVEQDYFQNLAAVAHFEVTGGELLFYLGDRNDSNTEVMRFASRE